MEALSATRQLLLKTRKGTVHPRRSVPGGRGKHMLLLWLMSGCFSVTFRAETHNYSIARPRKCLTVASMIATSFALPCQQLRPALRTCAFSLSQYSKSAARKCILHCTRDTLVIFGRDCGRVHVHSVPLGEASLHLPPTPHLTETSRQAPAIEETG